MTWFKLDDTFPDHPKVVAAGGQAAWLYVAGLAYCSRGLTDGHIPAAVVARLTDLPKPAELAAKLVAVGLWVEQDGGYAVHDYADHQRTRAQIDADRDRWKTQKRRQRDDTTGPMSAVDIPRTSRGVRGMSAEVSAVDITRSPRNVRAPETETETETERVNGCSQYKPGTRGRSIENDPRWQRLATTMTQRGDTEANTYRTIHRLQHDENIADHLLDAAAGQTIATPGAGLGYLTTIARQWYAQRTGA